jgi:hypothetical protein
VCPWHLQKYFHQIEGALYALSVATVCRDRPLRCSRLFFYPLASACMAVRWAIISGNMGALIESSISQQFMIGANSSLLPLPFSQPLRGSPCSADSSSSSCLKAGQQKYIFSSWGYGSLRDRLESLLECGPKKNTCCFAHDLPRL